MARLDERDTFVTAAEPKGTLATSVHDREIPGRYPHRLCLYRFGAHQRDTR